MGAKRKRRKRRNAERPSRAFLFQDGEASDLRIALYAPFSDKADLGYNKPLLWQYVFSIKDYQSLLRKKAIQKALAKGMLPFLDDAVDLLWDKALRLVTSGGPWGDMPRCSSLAVYVDSKQYGEADYVQRDLDGSLFLDGPEAAASGKVDWEGDCRLSLSGRKKNPMRPGETYDVYLRRLEREAVGDPTAAEELALARARVATPVYNVFARNAAYPTGRTTGGQRRCGLAGCNGVRIGVRWDDGTMSWPCSKGLVEIANGWRIV